MNSRHLNELLEEPAKISGADLLALEQLCREFPWFSLPWILLAKGYHDRSDYRFRTVLHAAALRCSDRAWLKDFIEGSDNVLTREEPDAKVEAFNRTRIGSAEANHAVEEVALTDIEAVKTEEEMPTAEILTNTGVEETILEMVSTPTEVLPENKESEAEDAAEETHRTETADTTETDIPADTTDTPVLTETEEPKAEPVRIRPVPEYSAYSIEDYFPPEAEHETSPGPKDFFSWLKNPDSEPMPPAEQPAEKEKDELIERFLKTRPSVSRPRKEFFNPVNIAKKSEELDTELVTETLAKIYWQQKNYEAAIRAFEKLVLKYPEKRPYFAGLIQKIRNESKEK
jgi:hypothetical protein